MVHARDDGSTGEGGGVGADEGEGAPSSDGPGLKPDRPYRKRPASARYAKSLDDAIARVRTANQRLIDQGRSPLSTAEHSTIWSSVKDAFVHICVCGAEVKVAQTKNLVNHGLRCPGVQPSARHAPSPPAHHGCSAH